MLLKILGFCQVVVAHAFNPSTWETKEGRSLKFETSLVYKDITSRVSVTQRNPVSKDSVYIYILVAIQSDWHFLSLFQCIL